MLPWNEKLRVTNHFVPNNLVQLVRWLEHSKPWQQVSGGRLVLGRGGRWFKALIIYAGRLLGTESFPHLSKQATKLRGINSFAANIH